MNSIAEIVEHLNLVPHPEGGFYKETYRSTGVISQDALGNAFTGTRNYSTTIYFLLTSDNFSGFHRLKQDEVWHFYAGSTLFVHVIDPTGRYVRHQVGMNLDAGELPQLVVPAGCWFASSVKDQNSYSLVGCTVAPGFDFDDFELAKREALSQDFPAHKEIIKSLTRV